MLSVEIRLFVGHIPGNALRPFDLNRTRLDKPELHGSEPGRSRV